MNIAQQFGHRSQQYELRARALDAALQRLQLINRGLNFGTLGLTAVGVGWFWHGITAQHLVLLGGGMFVLRWIANMIVTFTWTNPTLRRIDREFPEPEPRI